MAKVLFSNNASTTLFSSISADTTQLKVASGTGALFPSPNTTKGEYFTVTVIGTDGVFEIIKVTARAGDKFTIQRAQEGTSPLSFEQGSIVEHRLTAASLNLMASGVSDFSTVTSGLEDDLSALTTKVNNHTSNPSSDFIWLVKQNTAFNHAAKHAANASDPITPASIGAAAINSSQQIVFPSGYLLWIA